MKLRSFCGFALILLSVSRYALSAGGDCTIWNGASNIWDNALNWAPPPPSCIDYPGQTTPLTDSAIFKIPIIGTGVISSGHSITINSLQFNAGAGNYTLGFGGGNTLTFAGTNPTFQVNAGSQSLATIVNLASNTVLSIANGATLTFAAVPVPGSISGPFTLDINGSGSLVNNTISNAAISTNIINFNGPTVSNAINGLIGTDGNAINVTGGTINNSGTIGQQNNAIVISNGTFNNITFGGNLGGPAFNNNTSVTISGGTVNNGGDGSAGQIGANILEGFTGNTNTLIITGGTINNIGSFIVNDFTGTSDTITISGGTINNTLSSLFARGLNNITMTISSGEITNDATSTFLSGGTTLTMTGGTLNNSGSALGAATENISGGTIVNNSGGTLGQSNSVFTMTGGTLQNDGTVFVKSGNSFTLSGSGLVEGKGSFRQPSTSPFTFINSGTVMPGDALLGGFSPGTLTFGGSGQSGTYQQNANGTLVIGLQNPTTFGQISANTAMLGGKLTVEGLSGFIPQVGEEFTIVTTTNGLSGTFASIQGINLDSLTPEVRYTGNSAILFFISQAVQMRCCPVLNCYAGSFYETIITSVNRINIHLEREMEKMRMHFTKNTTRSSRPIASIAKHSDQLLAANDWSSMLGIPHDPMFADSNNFADFETLEKQEIMKRSVQSREEYPLNIYIGPLGSVGDFESRERGRQVGFDYWSAGVLAGFDYVFDQAGVGLLANYERFEGDVDRHWGRFTIDEAHAAAYATYAPAILPEMAFDAIVGGGYDWVSIRRNTSTSKAEGHPNTGEFDALFEAEYTFASRQFESFPKTLQVIPLANVQYVYLTIDDYTEHGGSADFSFNKQRIDSLRSTVGARVNYNWECPNVSFIPELYLAWQREYLDTDHTVRATPVAGGPASFIEIDGVGRNFALVGVDFLFAFYKRWGLEFSYDFEWNDLFTDNFFFAGFNVRF